MNPEELAGLGRTLLEEDVLPKYCWWLNQWWNSEGYLPEPQASHAYTPEQFLVTDHDRRLHGDSRVDGGMEIGASGAFNRLLFNYTIYDGDDGGPTELTAWYEDVADDEDGWKLLYLIQGFDTMLQVIYDAADFDRAKNPWLNLPTKED
jgi:hypothetical protein